MPGMRQPDEREESTDLTRGCLWGVALGLLLWAIGVAVVIVAILQR